MITNILKEGKTPIQEILIDHINDLVENDINSTEYHIRAYNTVLQAYLLAYGINEANGRREIANEPLEGATFYKLVCLIKSDTKENTKENRILLKQSGIQLLKTFRDL